MALAFATRPLRLSWVWRGKKIRRTDITLDASYVNGTGWAATKAQLGFASNETIDMVDILPPHSGFQFTVAITATGITIRAWKTGAGLSGAFAEAATNEAGLNGLVLTVVCTGN